MLSGAMAMVLWSLEGDENTPLLCVFVTLLVFFIALFKMKVDR